MRGSARRAVSCALVAALSLLTVLASRRARKPFSPDAPSFRSRGPAGAKVLIVEFSDFECPNCRASEATLRGIFALYGDGVRLVFKQFPLPPRVHPWAMTAAVAAECAGRQGKFWEYHDRLFDAQGEWTNARADDILAGYARDLGLDVPAWQACRRDPDAASVIAADIKDGDDAWVGGTPTFFINGRRFVARKQLAELGVPFIDRELKK